jgi:hypothetical protein
VSSPLVVHVIGLCCDFRVLCCGGLYVLACSLGSLLRARGAAGYRHFGPNIAPPRDTVLKRYRVAVQVRAGAGQARCTFYWHCPRGARQGRCGTAVFADGRATGRKLRDEVVIPFPISEFSESVRIRDLAIKLQWGSSCRNQSCRRRRGERVVIVTGLVPVVACLCCIDRVRYMCAFVRRIDRDELVPRCTRGARKATPRIGHL